MGITEGGGKTDSRLILLYKDLEDAVSIKRTRCNKGRFWPHVRNKFFCHYNLVKYQYLQEI